MLSLAEIDEKVQQGYIKIYKEKNCTGGCDLWLQAWEGLKDVMETERLPNIDALEDKYMWQQFISNYVQDLEMELKNAGTEEKTYYEKHITYCRELIDRCGRDHLMLENTRRGMAESYFCLGDHGESDRLFEEWLQADPDWGWGYIGWADCYAWLLKKPLYDKACGILERGLSRPGLRDRIKTVGRAIKISEKLGDAGKARSYRQEKQRLSSVHVEKIGPNDPCPCGSGKKHKKCCAP